MNDQSDSQLLDAYVQRHSEPAFTQLVQRHLDLVYSAALRIVGDAHAARDVSQGAFIALAQNAPKLAGRPVLAGWLYNTTRNLATKVVRSDVRRRIREQEAAAMNELHSTEPDANWEQIAAHLDEAISQLEEPDRDALLLRYFKNQDLRTLGAAFGISDDAAQKRVSRAIEHLREFLGRRGLRVGAAGLAVCISAKAVQAAPAGVAVEISKTALMFGTTAAVSNTIAITTIPKVLVGATLVIAIGTGIYEMRQAAEARSKSDTLQQQQSKLATEIDQLRRERDAATAQVTALRRENQLPNRNQLELLKLRDEVARLRTIATNAAPVGQLVQPVDAPILPIPTEAHPRTGRVELKWDNVMMLGINRIPNGKHAQLYIVPKRGEGPTQLSIQAYLVAYPTGFMQPAAFGEMLGTFRPEEADMLVEAAKNAGAQVMGSGPATFQSGEQSTIEIDISQADQTTGAPAKPATSNAAAIPPGTVPSNPTGVFPGSGNVATVQAVTGYVGTRTPANPTGVFPGPGTAAGIRAENSSEPANTARFFLGSTTVSQPQSAPPGGNSSMGLDKMVIKITPTISPDGESAGLDVETWFAAGAPAESQQ